MPSKGWVLRTRGFAAHRGTSSRESAPAAQEAAPVAGHAGRPVVRTEGACRDLRLGSVLPKPESVAEGSLHEVEEGLLADDRHEPHRKAL